jgi:hypothetical protein
MAIPPITRRYCHPLPQQAFLLVMAGYPGIAQSWAIGLAGFVGFQALQLGQVVPAMTMWCTRRLNLAFGFLAPRHWDRHTEFFCCLSNTDFHDGNHTYKTIFIPTRAGKTPQRIKRFVYELAWYVPTRRTGLAFRKP